MTVHVSQRIGRAVFGPKTACKFIARQGDADILQKYSQELEFRWRDDDLGFVVFDPYANRIQLDPSVFKNRLFQRRRRRIALNRG